MAQIHLMAGCDGAKINVVLVHGLGGHYRNTWIAGKDKNTFWPDWLQQDVPEVGIWSVEYKTRVFERLEYSMGLKDRAENIFELLINNNSITSGDVIFIGHSQGGLLIKQIIRLASDRASDPKVSIFLNRITGVAFLGTPHLGSDLSNVGNLLFTRILSCSLTLGGKPSAMTASLYRNSPCLRELNVWYRHWDRTFAGNHLILGESVKTAKLSMIVKPDSSDPGIRENMILVDTDHGGICKPDTRQHEVYQHVLSFVKTGRMTPQNFWLRSYFSDQVSGWSGYQNWSGGISVGDSHYIIDEDVKFADATLDSQNKIKVEDMLTSVRQKLSTPGAVIRLVGLSGVGKTRFIQALFEPNVGVAPLSQEKVFYTDTSYSPLPTPITLLEKLIATGQEAVLVIDNCSIGLHKSLVSVLQMATNLVSISIITVEYDICEDIPEKTEVISMESNSKELIEKLITSHFPSVNQLSCCKIAEFSGGNARVALVLASTIGRDENISRLRDRDLFNRLFNQRNDDSKELLNAGSVLSLVYSFMYVAKEGCSNELVDLGRIARLEHDILYSSAREIHRRGLAQVRGDWMAILPHPVANKLAQMALENIPHTHILSILNPDTNERLFRSFTRRLGYLSDSRDASDIVNKLLSHKGTFEGMLAQGKYQYKKAFALISNVAPIAQEQTLEFIERVSSMEPAGWFFTRENQSFFIIAHLLRSIAYEKKYFKQCARLLCCFAENENSNEKSNSATDLLLTLFNIHLSGTHAPLSLRMEIISDLLIESRNRLALLLLERLLKSMHFTSLQDFSFGAQVRDFGYIPLTRDDYNEWFCTVLDFIIDIIDVNDKNPTLSRGICEIVSRKLRTLWKVRPAQNKLFMLIEKLVDLPGDEMLWSAVNQTIRFELEHLNNEEKDTLYRLELLTRPDTLEEKLNVFIFSTHNNFYGLEQYDENGQLISGNEVALKKAAEIGREVAKSQSVIIDDIITRALSSDSNYFRMMAFSSELASEVSDPAALCQSINAKISLIGTDNIKNIFICGVLQGVYKQSHDISNTILDAYLKMPEMDKHFARIQLSIPIDDKGVERLKLHLQGPERDVSDYMMLSAGRRHAMIPDGSLIELLQLLWKHQNKPIYAFSILSIRIYDDNNIGYSCSEPLLELAREWVLDIITGNLVSERDIPSYEITSVAKRAFRECSIEQFSHLLTAIVQSHLNYSLHHHDINELIELICKYQPLVILNRLCSEAGVVDKTFCDIILRCSYNNKESPLAILPLDVVLTWCQQDPLPRYPCIAALIFPYEMKEKHYIWTAMAKALIETTPSPEPVLYNLVLNSNAAPDSIASHSDDKIALLRELQNSTKKDIVIASKKVLKDLRRWLDNEQKQVERSFRWNYERFEE